MLATVVEIDRRRRGSSLSCKLELVDDVIEARARTLKLRVCRSLADDGGDRLNDLSVGARSVTKLVSDRTAPSALRFVARGSGGTLPAQSLLRKST